MAKRVHKSQQRLPTSYKERLEEKKKELRRTCGGLLGWGMKHNPPYTRSQMYAVSRRHVEPAYGTIYEIAKELGLIDGEQA